MILILDNHLWISKENVTLGDDLNVKEAWSINLPGRYMLWPDLKIKNLMTLIYIIFIKYIWKQSFLSFLKNFLQTIWKQVDIIWKDF